uniref:acyl-coenzyme A thioesterase 1-like n=1 Tax=Styela clava TaxID=7725 RepID=UPI00193A5C58|nr:acyl-coenzyme A thioesterase 1-like [Styela clava]
MSQIVVNPRNGLADEQVTIKFTNLRKSQKITIQSCQTSDSGAEFHSYAYFEADDNGEVDFQTASSHGGYFHGIDPIGLFWSMKKIPISKKSYSSLNKMNVERPSVVLLNLYDGHVNIDASLATGNLYPLSLVSTTFERRFLDSKIDRVLVQTGDLRGVMFVPRSKNRFLGVIDINGAVGGSLESRGALLANHGFVVMCLSLFGANDQPKTISFIDLEYIERGINFLLSHNNVQKDGVALVGMSLGGTASMAAAGCLENIKCIVNIVGPIVANLGFHYRYKGRQWKAVEVNRNLAIDVDGAHILEKVVQIPKLKDLFNHIPNFSKSKAPMLFIYGSEDSFMDWRSYVLLINEIFTESKKTNYKINIYKGTGHLLLPPVAPLVKESFYDSKNVALYGGSPKSHYEGQINAWIDIIEFLKQNNTPLSNL